MSELRRILLFGTELYALPILRPLAAAAARRGIAVRWFLHGVGSRYLESAETRLESASQVRSFDAQAVYAASNWIPDFFPGAKVQVFHGFNVEKRDAAKGHFRLRGLFDLYCTQGPATTEPFQQLAAQHGYFAVRETGWPKLDPLFAPGDAESAALREPANGRPVVLFGSTFTPGLSAAPLLHEEIARLVARGDRYWLLTLHPKCDADLFARYRALQGPNARFVESDRLVALMRAADVLLADTSSIVPEFALQQRGVVTFRNRAPKPYMLDMTEAAAVDTALTTALAPDAPRRAALAALAAAIHPWHDGRSSERVLDATADFLAGRLPLRARQPLNLWRRLQMRAWLGWWRP